MTASRTTARAGSGDRAWRDGIGRFLARGIIVKTAIAFLIAFIIVSVFADLVAPYDPNGQDNLGRDVLSRIIYGGRVTLSVSFLAGTLAAILGIALGLAAGYRSGRLGRVIMGATDVWLSIPSLVVSLVLAAILGGGVSSLVFAIGLGMAPGYIRMVNGLVLTLRENDYIVAARLIGRKEIPIVLKHLLPNCFPTLIVLYTINLGNGVLTESTLSYLGVGVSPPTASWGSMVSDVYPYLLRAPWLVVSPGVCIILIIISMNLVGDGLRDALDPRLRGKV